MKTETVSAVVLRAADYKDYDKLLTLITPDSGVISAVLKGVRKQGAKLKFAAQSFSFNRYTLVERNAYRTVTECVPIESLFEITADPDRYTAGAVALEVTDRAVNEIASPEAFVELLKALKALAYAAVDPYAVLAKYLMRLLDIMGYGITYRSSPFIDIEAGDYETLSAIDRARPAAKRLAAVCEERFYCKLKSAAML